VKPTGPIPSDFQAIRGELAIAGRPVSELVAEAGDTPLFVYDGSIIRARVAALRAAMPTGLAIHYAIKANPNHRILALLAELVDGFDVASIGEMANAMDFPVEAISFAGPGKRDHELAAAMAWDVTINLESEAEADRALRIAEAAGKTPALAVRVNPDFAITGAGMRMGGGARPFGIDAERVPALVRRLRAAGADWRGFHVFAGSQSLDAQAIAAAQSATVALVAELAEDIGAAPPTVNLGGGFGIPYFAGDQSLDIGAVGAALGETLAARPALLADSAFAIELGRWLVGEAGVYLTRVIDRKTSHGESFVITDGGLHHMLAASGNFGTVVRRNYPIAHAGRFAMPSEELVTVTGCLCTPLDLLGDNVALPHAEVGDVIAIFMAGAYAASASPQAFLNHPPAAELLVDTPQTASS
jgi:diaminopimelate decarboxylase